jgi:hypothetical protein
MSAMSRFAVINITTNQILFQNKFNGSHTYAQTQLTAKSIITMMNNR